jgi:hypothetical protein
MWLVSYFVNLLGSQLVKHPNLPRTLERINLCKVNVNGTASELRKLN